MEPKYKRVILKISGEALAGDKHVGLDEEMLDKVALEVKQIRDMGVQVAVVVGGGNFWRGRTSCRTLLNAMVCRPECRRRSR